MKSHFRKRPLVFISATFVLSQAFCYYFACGYWKIALLVCIAAAAAAVTLLLIRGRGIYTVLLCVTAVMPALGILNVGLHYEFIEKPASDFTGVCVIVEATVRDVRRQENGYMLTLENAVFDGAPEGGAGVCLRVSNSTPHVDRYDRIRAVLGKIYPASESYRAIYDAMRAEDVFICAYGTVLTVGEPDAPFLRAVRAVRSAAQTALDRLIGGENVRSFILGDNVSSGRQSGEDLRQSGASHLFAVSGMHVSVVMSVLFMMLYACGAGQKPAFVAAGCMLVIFTAAVGASFSVMRAAVMAAVFMTAASFMRKNDLLVSLFIAVGLVCAVFPYSSGSTSLKLSFLSTLGIASYGLPAYSRLRRRVRRALWEARAPAAVRLAYNALFCAAYPVFMCAAAMTFSFPVILAELGGISTAAPISALFVVPAASAVIFLAPIYAAVSAIPFAGAVLSAPVGAAIDVLTGAAFGIARLISELPCAYAYFPAGTGALFPLILSAALIAGALAERPPRFYLILTAALGCALLAG